VEQILLYIVTISGFSGLMLGVYSLLVPVLQRRGVRLPFSGRGDSDDDALDYEDDEDSLAFAANSFSARRGSLLERVPRQKARKPAEEEDEDDLDLDEELLGDLDLSKELAEVQAEDDDEDEDDQLAALTFDAEVDPVLEELAEDDDLEEEEDGDEDDEEGEEEDGEDDEDGEYEDEEEEEAAEEVPQTPVVQVVHAGGGDDMLSLFGEGSDVVKEIEAWRADLPNPSIDELVAEARELGAMLKGRRQRA
jgi:hypothetical protein